MSARLILWASHPDAAWLDPADTPLALGALLVLMAREELAALLPAADRIDEVLARRYDLTRSEAAEMRRACEDVARRLPDGPAYMRLVQAHVCAAERAALAQCLWALAGSTAETRNEAAAAALSRGLGLGDETLAPLN
ncbi:TerB family tellurite resistance protein [Roseivivax isoporae]|uniref:Co-chaperone DjlA N-terminal domain-containing protein n=1 Tax=Roseivivax isoporae LMG 25204 TaxID=1449351 RepID=X7FDE0_9RHOB|nr:TerB family tellurite resistance protein [Roseivivax isoporae]ETX30044.1 hypothetical protein RISW2_17760 [Roseivivax isoporae LMG 25204]